MLKCLVRKAIVKAPLRVSVSVSRMTAARASPQRLAGAFRVRDGGPAEGDASAHVVRPVSARR